jgi:hypothetical protein
MPLLSNNNQPPNNNQTSNCGLETTQKSNQCQTQKPSGLMTLIANLLPMAPLAFEQITGQKVPQLSGTVAEMQMALINIQSNLQTIVNNQQQLVQRLTALETNAHQHLANLTHQFNSLRLIHTKERKQIEFDRPQLESSEENY